MNWEFKVSVGFQIFQDDLFAVKLSGDETMLLILILISTFYLVKLVLIVFCYS